MSCDKQTDRQTDRQTDMSCLFSSNVLCDIVRLDELKHVSVVAVVTVKHFKSHKSALLQAH